MGMQGLTGPPSTAGASPTNDAIPWRIRNTVPESMCNGHSQLWLSSTIEETPTCLFHVSIWILNNNLPEDKFGWMMVRDITVNPMTFEPTPKTNVLVFDSRKNRDDFNEWLASYTARFGSGDWKTQYLPSIQAGDRVTGFAMPSFDAVNKNNWSMYDGMHPSWLKEWAWIVANTHDKVLFVNEFWLFENESEMLMFKLRDTV
jgi:hypothetical protein